MCYIDFYITLFFSPSKWWRDKKIINNDILHIKKVIMLKKNIPIIFANFYLVKCGFFIYFSLIFDDFLMDYWKITGWNRLIFNVNGISTSFCVKKLYFQTKGKYYDHVPQSIIFPLETGTIISSHKRMWKFPIYLSLIFLEGWWCDNSHGTCSTTTISRTTIEPSPEQQ